MRTRWDKTESIRKVGKKYGNYKDIAIKTWQSIKEAVKIEDIRNLKKKILKSSLLDKDRFIIFDDIELLNINSLNALLKIIEEPSEKNYFILMV